MSPTPSAFMNLAVLHALSISESEARDTVLINLGVGRIQERKGSVASPSGDCLYAGAPGTLCFQDRIEG
jgi:hypothetical protein